MPTHHPTDTSQLVTTNKPKTSKPSRFKIGMRIKLIYNRPPQYDKNHIFQVLDIDHYSSEADEVAYVLPVLPGAYPQGAGSEKGTTCWAVRKDNAILVDEDEGPCT